jgi:cellulose biosynthesis protein BcsQ
MQRLLQTSPQFVCAIINRKGGTGKSNTTVNFAGELALRGYRVGVIDTDSQGNASLYFGMQPEDGLFKALIGQQDGSAFLPVPLGAVVQVVPQDSYFAHDVDENNQLTGFDVPVGEIFLLPSGQNTFRIPYFLDDVDKFGELVDEMIASYQLDIVLIDTAPTMSMFDGAVYQAVNGFLYVTEPEIGALQGLQQSFTQVENLNRRRAKRGLPSSAVLGILVNKLRSLREHIDNVQNIRETFPHLYYPPLRLLKSHPSANKYGMTVRAYAPGGAEAFEMLQAVNRFEQGVFDYVTRGAR